MSWSRFGHPFGSSWFCMPPTPTVFCNVAFWVHTPSGKKTMSSRCWSLFLMNRSHLSSLMKLWCKESFWCLSVESEGIPDRKYNFICRNVARNVRRLHCSSQLPAGSCRLISFKSLACFPALKHVFWRLVGWFQWALCDLYLVWWMSLTHLHYHLFFFCFIWSESYFACKSLLGFFSMYGMIYSTLLCHDVTSVLNSCFTLQKPSPFIHLWRLMYRFGRSPRQKLLSIQHIVLNGRKRVVRRGDGAKGGP